MPTADSSAPAGNTGRGRRSGTPAADTIGAKPESEDDAKRLQQLTAEARSPAGFLTIAETSSAISITSDQGPSRTFHADGREEVIQLGGVPVAAIAKREPGRLSIRYLVERGRELRYTYSRNANPPQLIVEVEFWERSVGDRARRVYEPANAEESTASSPIASAAKPDGNAPGAGAPDTAKPGASAPPAPPAQTFNQRPGAELKGLANLGLVVEDLDPQAAACGLNQSTLETALSRRLSDAGFKVRRNSDEDTYVYVNIGTRSLSTGLCVSRYDVFLYTHTTAKLSYQETPVLVQVSLLHRGGLAGGSGAAHADGVLRGLQEYVDLFTTQIRAANSQK